MPRPPKPVTEQDFPLLYPQLARLLADKTKAGKALSGALDRAIAAFNAVGDSPTLLDEWVSRWLTPAARQRMWASLRQLAYKKKQHARVLMISDEAYTALSDAAKRHQMTLSEAILFLAKDKK
jgi:macrodomain Ter protein organizer (MatP/YcbG family)